MAINKIVMQGFFARDPELSYLPSQTAIVEFSIAHTHKYESGGQKHEDTCFVTCKMFGKRAEVIQKYFSKGKPIIIEGRLKLETWEKDGKKHYKHVIMVDEFHFLPNNTSTSTPAPQQQVEQPQQQQNTNDSDDIPF